MLRCSDKTVNRGLYLLHMHSTRHEINISWYSIEGGSVIVGVERVSGTYRYPVRSVGIDLFEDEHNYMGDEKKEKTKKHSENADTSTSVTFDLVV